MIFNPAAGRARARRRMAAFLARWKGRVTLRPTERAEHAADLAAAAVGGGFDVIAAAGGDGTVHEVAGGLLRATGGATGGAGGPTFAVVPVGSANDYAHSLQRQFGPAALDDGVAFPVDVGVLRADPPAGDPPERFFVCCCGAGLAGRVTMESRGIRSLQGPLLYGLAAWRAVRRGGPPTEWAVALDGGPPAAGLTRSFHTLLGRREGSFLLAPNASLDDGLFDTVRVGPAGRWELLRMLPALTRGGPPAAHPHVRLGRCESVRVESPEPLAVHADGELAFVPADGVRALTLDLLPGRLRAKVCPPG